MVNSIPQRGMGRRQEDGSGEQIKENGWGVIEIKEDGLGEEIEDMMGKIMRLRTI